ncbi:hypothetical protein [Phytoactinopolyspora mesophila]|uniref:DUF4352 domain-containing protein n=1 Tax=Phytoactinopolyspora mesophila TaxID=2650750 RepID=A0A7K3MA23_9ACTN|nr:hypothetical protein [Phytoactinopolyspora mesophila]NDL60181.1 hypothetical protein [Phytoactinopolyspora mesophila]
MNTNLRFAAVLAAATLTVAGCGSSDDNQSVSPDVEAVPMPTVAEDDDAPPTAEAESAPMPTRETAPDEADETDEPDEPELPRSQRGNLIKEIGETAGAYNEHDGPESPWLEFQVTDIEVGGQCTSDYAEASQNGHFLIVSIAASTGSELSESLYGQEVWFDSYEFSVVGADGVTENDVEGNAYMCLASRDEMPRIGPGENATGMVALDVSAESGTLVFKPWFMDGAGWEWEF